MNGLFGLELPTPVNFVIAFVVVLALIGAATWLVRRFGVTRLEAAARGRQPRLAVIDSAAVDGRRKLVIIRRDNVEHLLMIGGPTDVVVETNIVRSGTLAAREAPVIRAAGAEMLPRAMPLPEATPWPLQPEPVATPAPRPARVRAAEDAAQWPMQSEPSPAPAATARPQRGAETLAGLAVELSRPAGEPAAAAAPRQTQPEPARASAPQPAPATHDEHPAAGDQNLANMAHQLEAALRRPMQPIQTPQGHAPQGPAAKPAPEAATRAAASAEPRRAEPKPAPRTEQKPVAAKVTQSGAQPAPGYDSLEQEMASLLGRPGKT
jgi:hypothetical protein